jgi:hypothetical protein
MPPGSATPYVAAATRSASHRTARDTHDDRTVHVKTQHSLKLVAASMLALTLLTGCGGGGGGRPSVGDISSTLQDGDNAVGLTLDADQADCFAKVFHDSDISDEALQAMVDQDGDYDPSEEDTKALTALTSSDDAAKCVTG